MKSYKEGKFSDLFYFELLSRSLGKRGYPRETRLLHIVTEAVSAPLELIRFQAEELDAQNLNNYKKIGGFVFSFFFTSCSSQNQTLAITAVPLAVWCKLPPASAVLLSTWYIETCNCFFLCLEKQSLIPLKKKVYCLYPCPIITWGKQSLVFYIGGLLHLLEMFFARVCPPADPALPWLHLLTQNRAHAALTEHQGTQFQRHLQSIKIPSPWRRHQKEALPGSHQSLLMMPLQYSLQ